MCHRQNISFFGLTTSASPPFCTNFQSVHRRNTLYTFNEDDDVEHQNVLFLRTAAYGFKLKLHNSFRYSIAVCIYSIDTLLDAMELTEKSHRLFKTS